MKFLLKYIIIPFLKPFRRFLLPLTKNFIHTTKIGDISIKLKGGLRFLCSLRRRYYLTPEEIFFSKLDLKDKVVYDIGAFIGLKTILFAKKAKQVIAFEPNYGTFAIMEENITLNNLDNVRTLSCGIGDKTDIKLLSFNPLFPGCGSMKIETKGKVVKTLTEVYSLDDCIKKFNLSIPDFIKIDIEGMEDEALEGMTKTMKKYKPALYIEVHGINKEDKDKHIMSIGRTLLTYNYTVDLVDAEGHIYCV